MTGLLRTIARHAAYGLTQALHGPPAPTHGPLPPEYCDAPEPEGLRDILKGGRDLAVENGWLTAEQADDAVDRIAASAPPMRGERFSAAACVAGTPASAGQWAIAISAAGKQLSDEGFEDQAVMCFVAAGELDAIAHGDIAR